MADRLPIPRRIVRRAPGPGSERGIVVPFPRRHRRLRRRELPVLLGFLVLAFAPALVGAPFGPDAWYASLEKPSWNPPPPVFAPVWTALYLALGVAGFLAWRASRGAARRAAFAAYGAHLALNAAWTPLFFGAHAPTAAAAVLSLVVVAASVNLALFSRIRPAAGVLLAPVVAWVAFAFALNLAIVRLQ